MPGTAYARPVFCLVLLHALRVASPLLPYARAVPCAVLTYAFPMLCPVLRCVVRNRRSCKACEHGTSRRWCAHRVPNTQHARMLCGTRVFPTPVSYTHLRAHETEADL
eukprot:372862-Rhodomonas_salina.1